FTGSSPAQFVLLISHSKKNVMQCKELSYLYMIFRVQSMGKTKHSQIICRSKNGICSSCPFTDDGFVLQ
ncbi:MAG: hypothetical protein ACI4KN_06370, partial [Gemmiger sp.]